jgi:tRNA(Arg) A34 adenosine deaminase TadA
MLNNNIQTGRLVRWIQRALKISRRSLHSQHRVAALVIRGGNVLGSAVNSSSITYGSDKWSKHAEVRALRPNRDYTGATILVARHGGSMSRPCHNCMAVIKDAHIKEIVYLDWNGNLRTERVDGV